MIKFNLLIFLLILILFSCNKKEVFCENSLSKNGKIFSCNDKNAKDFSFLSNKKYKYVEALDLTGTKALDLTFLKNLKNLKVLLLINTKIKNIESVKNLKNLEELYLSRTEIKDINVLKNLKKLKILHIDNTKVEDIKALKNIYMFNQLDIRNTKINIKIDSKKNRNFPIKDFYDGDRKILFGKLKDNSLFFLNTPLKRYLDTASNMKNKNYNKKDILYGEASDRNDISGSYKTTIKDFDKIKYEGVSIKNLRNYKSLLISLYNKFEVVEYLNLFGASHSYKNSLEFEDISSIKLLNNLEILKLHLKNDKYIDNLKKLLNLKELHLSGNIKKIPKLENLEKLYLYNTKVDDFSFLNKSNIKYLYIVTKNFKDNFWQKLKKSYPKIKIVVKNRLFTPIKPINKIPPNLNDIICGNSCYKNFTKSLKFDGPYLTTECYYIIRDMRRNSLYHLTQFGISISDIKFILDINIDINHIWEENITFLDILLKNKDYKKNFNYLRLLGAKKACEILNKKCD